MEQTPIPQITRLEFFAAAALQDLLAGCASSGVDDEPPIFETYAELTDEAIRYAWALEAALARPMEGWEERQWPQAKQPEKETR